MARIRPIIVSLLASSALALFIMGAVLVQNAGAQQGSGGENLICVVDCACLKAVCTGTCATAGFCGGCSCIPLITGCGCI